jgi:uroporphyrinogen-III synthase
MTDHNVTGGTRRELTKYRITFAAALAAMALAGWMIQTAYEQHIKVLQIGDQTGERLQMRGLIQHQEGAQHEQR